MPHMFRIWWEDEGLNAPPKCLLRNLVQQSRSHTFIRHHIQPGLPRAYRDYPKVTESSPTCGRDDRTLRFPPLRLLYYFPPIPLVYVSEPKALVPILRPWKKVPRMANAQTQYPSVYCYILLWPQPTNQPTNPKRLPLPKFIATRSVVTKCLDDTEGTQEEEYLRI